MIRHLPSIERFRDRQSSSLEPNFSILARKFFLLFCFSSYDMKIPNARTGSLGYLNPNGFTSLSRQGPSHKVLVLVGFNRKPRHSQRNLILELLFQQSRGYYKLMMYRRQIDLASELKILIPCICLSCRILNAKISAPKMKR